jgi:hypothetical protein
VLLVIKWQHQKVVQNAKKEEVRSFVLDAKRTFAKDAMSNIDKRWLIS